MKTRLAVIASFFVLGAGIGLHGCANSPAVQIQAICYPTDTCTFASTCSTYFSGTAGIAGPGQLVVFMQVANQLPNNESLGIGRLNTNDAHIDEITVEFEGAQVSTQTAGTNAYVPAGGSSIVAVGLGITASGAIVARVTMSGYYDDGTRFDTGEFPISVFAGAGACPTSSCATGSATCPAGGAAQCPVACSSSTVTPTTYTVSGTVTGLTTDGLTLTSPGLADVSVPAGSTSFQFTAVPDGTAYDVTVRTQPTGQFCNVTSGSGTVSGGNASGITISCV